MLTATVLGGITLGGGKGSVTKSAVGTLIVLLITNGLTTMNARGGFNRMALASILLVAAVIDIRWQKNRARIISKVYVSPTYHDLPPPPTTEIGKGGPFEQNDKLRDVTLIGLGRIEAPGGRHSRSSRQSLRRVAPRRRHPLFRAGLPEDGGLRPHRRAAARHGVRPRTTISTSASAAWASIASRPTARSRRRPTKPTAACTSVNDDSRLRLADDLDITDNGLIFFSEATIRYEMDEWPIDGLEARGNGRIICYDTNTGRDPYSASAG